jgi:hypothetical protein
MVRCLPDLYVANFVICQVGHGHSGDDAEHDGDPRDFAYGHMLASDGAPVLHRSSS